MHVHLLGIPSKPRARLFRWYLSYPFTVYTLSIYRSVCECVCVSVFVCVCVCVWCVCVCARAPPSPLCLPVSCVRGV